MNRTLYLLDTNTVSYLINARSAAARSRFAEVQQYAGIGMSAISEAEIRYGLERKPVTGWLRADFEDFCSSVRVFPWDSGCAHAYAKLRAQLQRSGKSLADMDMLIAAHAMAVDATLVSSDKAMRHGAPAIAVEDWATDIRTQ